jgi:hypothetical protein
MTIPCGAGIPAGENPTSKCGAGAPARERPLTKCGAGTPARESFWVAQRFSAAVNRPFLSRALAPEGSPLRTENRELRTGRWRTL